MRRRRPDIMTVVRRAAFVAVLAAPTLIDACAGSTEPVRRLRLEATTPTSLTAIVGSEVTPAPTVRVTDGSGNPVAGIPIRFLKTGTGTIGNTSAHSDGSGLATTGAWSLGPRAGIQTITARSDGLPDVTFTAMATAGPVGSLLPAGGNKQTAAAGVTLWQPLRVWVGDAFGNAVAGAIVTFTVFSGEGSIDPAPALTDSQGMATSGAWTLATHPGAQQVRAQSEGVQLLMTAYACETDHCGTLLYVRELQIRSIDTADGVDRQLNTWGNGPASSPDGSRIAFSRYGTDTRLDDIYLMNADGSNVVRLTFGGNFTDPAWSPDGRTLAVTRGDVYDADVYLLGTDELSTAPIRIASMAAMPAWSPDGTKIAFVSLSGDDGSHALYVANADGSGVSELTVRDASAIEHPTWSPDGQRIAFSSCLTLCNIFVVRTHDRTVTQLTSVEYALSPAWSPDGTRVAFVWLTRTGDATVRSIAYTSAEGDGDLVPMVSPGNSPAWRP